MRTAIAAALLLAAGAGAQTQAPNLDQESRGAARRGQVQQAAAEKAALARAIDEVVEPSIDEVLRAPGDVELNERFARAQVRRGDLRGAASTLERVMLLAPERDRTRLVYAAVLFRLQDFNDAERELKLLKSRSLAPDLMEETDRYLKLVARRRRRTHFDARLSFGWGYDTNRNAAPDSDERLFFGQPVLLNPDSRRTEDTNVQLAGALGATREIGGASAHSAYARAGYYRGEQTAMDILDLQAYTGQAGFLYHTRWVDVLPALGYEHVLLSGDSYLRNFTQSLRAVRRLSRRAQAWAEFRREDQEFLRTPRVVVGDQRAGDQYDYVLGGLYILSPADRLTGTVGYRRKLALRDFNAYRRATLGAEYTRLFGKGTFGMLGVTADFDRYEREDFTVSSKVRRDTALTLDLLVGAPLSLVWKPLEGFTATAGFQRFQEASSITNYQYTNHKLTGLLSYQWGN